MGPSGSGKSTLLTVAGGLEAPTTGEVLVEGRAVPSLSRDERARLRRRTIGFVFQDYNLLAGLSAAENVALPLELDGMHARRAAAEAVAVLERLGLGGRATAFPDELSGGERQRVAIGRALLMKPRLLLLDEPLASLDRARKLEILPYLARLRDESHVPMVYVSHQAGEIQKLASQVVRIDDGRVLATGGLDLLDAEMH
jgi:putative ABC transport system ATP-binding protein